MAKVKRKDAEEQDSKDEAPLKDSDIPCPFCGVNMRYELFTCCLEKACNYKFISFREGKMDRFSWLDNVGNIIFDVTIFRGENKMEFVRSFLGSFNKLGEVPMALDPFDPIQLDKLKKICRSIEKNMILM